MKKKGVALLIAMVPASFFAGVYFSSDVDFKKYKHYEVREGYYERPYDLTIKTREFNGKVETYLVDEKTGEEQPVYEDMYVGDATHRVSGVISVPKEKMRKWKGSGKKLVGEIYDVVFGES